jgi:ferrous iron transport protein B
LLGGGVEAVLPEGVLRDLLSEGVVAGIAGVVVFLPQICLLFFLISLLEDTGYLARAAFVMDRVLRPFGLPGHAFVPLLSSHACALPGIMAARAIPDRRERLATILVAPFMTCSARLPVYVLVTGLLFPGEPLKAAGAFVGAYALGIVAGMGSALLARRTILRGPSRPMALELPTYKWPSVWTALMTTYDRAVVFLKKAGTNILAISIVLWWLSAFPHVAPPAEAVALREEAALVDASRAEELNAAADRLEASHASAESFMGRIGRTVQPVFGPLGYDWQLTVGVMASFAAREVFVSTMAVVVTGEEDAESEGVIERVAAAKRSDGVTPIFTAATCWSILVFYVLAMQCLPTLAVTAREAGGVRWAFLQLGWMSAVAYLAALVVYQGMRAAGVP